MMTSPQTKSSAIRALTHEFKSLQEEPVEGFRVKLVNDENLFEWEVAIFGPPETLYQGGYFKNGDLCISILHPPVEDPQSGELACERWNPTQNVRTILLSVISLLNEPNTSSPANVDASIMYRKWRDTKGKDKEYETIIKKQVAASKIEAEKDNVVVPTTLEEYCIRHRNPSDLDGDTADYYDDEDYDDGDDDVDDDQISDQENDDDSGNGEA
ncbi:ubiquitin-conjugating enzyme E2 R2-like protein [Sarcoptes scabiei]|uniref:Ubiquitin-conjugating enzyme E2 R2-like protein n=1 Tax=Sarcoptes scabiei TaxID=52283 RepID=A0A132A2U5_SARSC|nr:ubiquitin-conjugating enzyme E2 R2-like protein [Sarcoptes scabiei]